MKREVSSLRLPPHCVGLLLVLASYYGMGVYLMRNELSRPTFIYFVRLAHYVVYSYAHCREIVVCIIGCYWISLNNYTNGK